MCNTQQLLRENDALHGEEVCKKSDSSRWMNESMTHVLPHALSKRSCSFQSEVDFGTLEPCAEYVRSMGFLSTQAALTNLRRTCTSAARAAWAASEVKTFGFKQSKFQCEKKSVLDQLSNTFKNST